MKYLAGLFISILFFSPLNSQVYDFNNFTELHAEGNVPDDFTKLSSVKFSEDVENESEAQNKKEQKDKEQFLLESNFLMDNILHSGRVTFGDPVTEYLNQMKDVILKDQPEIRDQIRIYTLRSEDVNAFTANNGIVLVTTALVAKTDNEAQIAFILCHEFSHFIHKHPINSYVEGKKMERGDGIYKSLAENEIDLEKFKYSKELESEADLYGYDLFLTTPYATSVINSVFDILLYSDFPFAEIPFDKTFFNDSLYQLPEAYFLDSLNAISEEEDFDDEEMTHPNIKKRRDAVMTKLNATEVNEANNSLFIVSEEKYLNCRKICRYDICQVYISDIEYPQAIYNAYVLLKEDSDNFFLQKVITQALYGLSIYSNSDVWPEGYTKHEGESQQVYYLLHKIPGEELNVLALKYAWNVHKKYPDSKYVTEMTKHLARELVSTYKINDSEFYNAQDAQTKDTVYIQYLNELRQNEITNQNDSASISTPKTKSKLGKIKKDVDPKAKNYWKYAFAGARSDREFGMLFHQKYDEPEEGINVTLFRRRRPVYHLGADALVVVSPLYEKIDETKSNPVKFVAAERERVDLQEKITACGEELDLRVEYLDHNLIEKNEAAKFNDLAILNEWLMEQMSHADDEVQMLNSKYDEIQGLSDKYDSDHFAWFGIIGFTERENDWGKLIYGWIGGFMIPFIVSDLITPDYWTYVFVIVCDAETGQVEMTVYNAVEAKDGDSVQKSNIYYIMQQIKNK